MDHLVTFKTAEGRDANHTAANLDEALKFVERIRNAEDVGDVRVYRMQQVPIEFKAYYKVEVRPDGADSAAGEPGSAVPAPPADEGADAPSAATAGSPLVAAPSGDGEPGGDQGSRRLFARS